MANENKRIPQLPVLAAPMTGDQLVIYDNATGITKAIDVAYFLASLTSENFTYQPAKAYSFEDVAVYNGKWWSSLVPGVDTNTGNTPTEGAFWTEVSPSAAGFVAWSAGVYTATVNYVIGTLDGYDQLFKLVAATPYNSSNLAQEYAAGDWELMSERGYIGISKVAHGFAVNDVLTFKAGAWSKFAPGDTPLAIVKSVISVDLVTVMLTGNRIKNLSGLTAGSIYYAQPDATISTAATDNPLFVAISATEAVSISVGNTGVNHFRGAYATLGALQAAVPTGNPGDYAYVDAGAASDVMLYMWDGSDLDWILSGTGTTPTATESVEGKAEIATQTETNTGTDDARFVTPLKLRVSSDARYSRKNATRVDEPNATIVLSESHLDTIVESSFVGAVDFQLSNLSSGFKCRIKRKAAGTLSFSGYSGLDAVGAVVTMEDGDEATIYHEPVNQWNLNISKGKIEIATEAETDTGTSDLLAITPLKLQRKIIGEVELALNTLTPDISHSNKLVNCNNATSTGVTLDASLKKGTTIHFCKANTGDVTFIPDAGITIKKLGSSLSITQADAIVSAVYVGSNVWRLFGPLGSATPITTNWIVGGNTVSSDAESEIGTNSDHDVRFKTNSVVRMALTKLGNLSLGFFSSAGARLEVRGSGTTSSTWSAMFKNSSAVLRFAIRDDGRVGFYNAAGSETMAWNGSQLTFGGVNQYLSLNATSNGLAFSCGHILSGASGNMYDFLHRNADLETGPIVGIRFRGSVNGFNPDSGDASFTSIKLDPILNQSSTATGLMVGIDYDPVETGVLGPHYGVLIRSGRSGFKLGAGAPTAWIDIGAPVSGTAQFRLRDGAAVSAPNSGEIWHETTNNRLMWRAGANTREVVTSSGTTTGDTTPAGTVEVTIGGTARKLLYAS